MKTILSLIGVATVAAVTAPAQTISPVQATARPYGLDIVNLVMLAASDTRSADFQANVLPSVQSFLASTLPEGYDNTMKASAFTFDPSKIIIQSDYQVRIYIAHEGAGFHNSLGFNTTGEGLNSGDPSLIFPDGSITQTGTRTSAEPLKAGDFVELGTIKAGTTLDFFLAANGALGGGNVFGAKPTGNDDGLNHMSTFTAYSFGVNDPSSPYIFVGFEDLFGGGDKDFNDIVFAFDVGQGTVNALTGAPEPSTYMMLGSFLTMAIFAGRRMRARKS